MDMDGREYIWVLANLGTSICEKLKNIYFFDKKWPDCYKEVANRFTQLKRTARKFYCDKTELEMLQEIARYCEKDIEDAFLTQLEAKGETILVGEYIKTGK